MRSTKTGSPISSVFSIEPESLTKFWKMKPMMKRPTTRTEQMDASASSGVSLISASAGRPAALFASTTAASLRSDEARASALLSASLVKMVRLLPWQMWLCQCTLRRPVQASLPQYVEAERSPQSVPQRWRGGILVRLNNREVHHEGTTHNVSFRYKTPVAAVLTIVSVVAQNEQLSPRYGQLSVDDAMSQPHPPVRIEAGVRTPQRWEVIAEVVHDRGRVKRIRLFHRPLIDPHLPMLQRDTIARNRHYALHQVHCRIHWIVKDDEIAAMNVRRR